MTRFVTKKVRKQGRNERYSLQGRGGVRSLRHWRANVVRVYHLRSTFDIPDQVNLKWKVIITSERSPREERIISYLREKSEYSRPGPITFFKALYLRNRMSHRQAVFFDEYHLDVKVVAWLPHCVSAVHGT